MTRTTRWLCVCVLALSCACVDDGGGGAEGEGEGEATGSLDAGSDEGNSGGVCSFNRDCPAAERCFCTEQDGCACEVGARGTGTNGVDLCSVAEDCESAVCVEDADSTFTCSGSCITDDDCRARLPTCADIAFVGRICIRGDS